MENVDKLKKAKLYIDNMANGINPVTGENVPDEDTLNNVHISRCLFYVSGLLEELIENDKSAKRGQKSEFYITQEEYDSLSVSDSSVSISGFVSSINEHINDENREKLKYSVFTNWMMQKGFLEEIVLSNGNKAKRPTEIGRDIGIYTEKRTNSFGQDYVAVLYNSKAQYFLKERIPEILGIRS